MNIDFSKINDMFGYWVAWEIPNGYKRNAGKLKNNVEINEIYVPGRPMKWNCDRAAHTDLILWLMFNIWDIFQ